MRSRLRCRAIRDFAVTALVISGVVVEAAAGRIRGFVVSASGGTPQANVLIELYDYNYADTALHSVSTRTDGFFTFDSLPDNTYHLKATGGGYVGQWYAPGGNTLLPQYRLDAMMMEYDTMLVELTATPIDNSPSAVLEVTIRDTLGNLVTDVSMVELYSSDGQISATGMWQSDGVFRFDSLVPADYALSAYSQSFPWQYYAPSGNTTYEQYSLTIAKNDTLSMTMVLTPTPLGRGRLQGFVQGGGGAATNVTLYRPGYPDPLYWGATDSAGFFTLQGIPEQIYQIHLSTAGYPDQWYSPSGNTLYRQYYVDVIMAQYDTLDVMLLSSPVDNSPSSYLRVQMRDTAGSPVTTVNMVEIMSKDGQSGRVGNKIADDTYEFGDLVPGDYFLYVYANDYPSQYYSPNGGTADPVYFLSVGRHDTLDITMHLSENPPSGGTNETGALAGSVRASDGTPLSQAMVEVYPPQGAALAGTQSSADGSFLFPDIPALPHILKITHPSYPIQYYAAARNVVYRSDAEHFTVPAGDTLRLDITLTTDPLADSTAVPTPPGGIQGTVTESGTGTPLAGVRVTASPRSDVDFASSYPLGIWWSFVTYTDSAGTYALDGLPPDEYIVAALPGSSNHVCQFFPGSDRLGQAQPVTVDSSGTTAAASFALRPGGILTGRIVTSDGTGVADIELTLYENNGARHYRAYTDTRGSYRIEGIAGATYYHWIGSQDYYVHQDDNTEFAIQEGQTHTASPVAVVRGGYIRAALPLPPGASDTMWISHALYLYDPQEITAAGPHMPTHVQEFPRRQAPSHVTGPLPPGEWKLLVAPAPLDDRSDQSSTDAWYAPNLTYGFHPDVATFGAAPTVNVLSGDTVDTRLAPSTSGYSVFGTITGENNESFGTTLHYDVRAFIQEGDRYFCVSEARKLSDGRFELPGLTEGEEYFVQVWAETYPGQFWSPTGSSYQPDNAYLFTTSSHTPLDIMVVQNPGGTTPSGPNASSPIDLWAESTTDGVTLRWSLKDPTVPIEDMTLYRNAAGQVTKLTSEKLGQARDSVYAWEDTAPVAAQAPFVAYVVVGIGTDIMIRSNIHHIDPFQQSGAAAGELWIDAFGTKEGVAVVWGGDTSFDHDESRYAVLHRHDPATGWEVLDTCRGWCDWLGDHDLDPAADAGKTFAYKVEAVSSTGSRTTPQTSFTVTDAFLSGLARQLKVGPFEQYATIQSAIDAARDGDRIEVLPGTYAENLDFGGKQLSLEGRWDYGTPPVIDARGGTAVTVPYPAGSTKYSMMSRTRIEGFRFVNSKEAIRTSAEVEIGNCLFDRPARYAIHAEVDSASMATDMASNPFAPPGIYIDVYECTFVGAPAEAQKAAALWPRGLAESSGYDGRYDGAEYAYLSPVVSLETHLHIGNSIFYGVNEIAEDMFDFTGERGSVFLDNIVHWKHAAETPHERVFIDSSLFAVDPAFADTVLYFLPTGSPLYTMSTNGMPIGYDGERFDDDGPHGRYGPPPVVNLHASVTGPNRITVDWSPPAGAAVVRYLVYRVPGFDSLFYVAPDKQWDLAIPEDSIFAIIDSFSTTDTFFVDTTAEPGVPYIYAVAAVDEHGEEGEIEMPYPPALADYTVMIDERPSAVLSVAARPAGPSRIAVTWSASSAEENVVRYVVYRAPGKETLFFVNNQSRWEPRSVVYEQGLIDSFTAPGTATSFIDTTVAMGVPYVYRVAAVNAEGVTGPVVMPSPPVFSEYVVEIGMKTAMLLRGGGWQMVGPIGLDTLPFGPSPDRYLYRWNDANSEDKLYSRYETTGKMAPSRGYWFWSAHDTILTFSRDRLRSAFGAEPRVPLELRCATAGWNQISSPYPFPVAPRWLADFELYRWVAGSDTNAYVPARVLEPGQAYWIQVDRDTTLLLDPRPAADSALLAKHGRLAKRAAVLSWELQVALEGKGCADRSNYIGVIAPGLGKGVRCESGEPPPAFDYPQLYFLRSGDPVAADSNLRERLSRQYKLSEAVPEGALEWTVAIGPSTSPVTVRFAGLEGVPDRVRLFWLTARRKVDLRECDRIEIAPREQTTYGYIVATADPAGVSLYTGDLELHRVYPNPFGRTTTFQFVVPYGWGTDGSRGLGGTRQVSLRIYDVDGRLVATPLSRRVAVGIHRQVWDGRTDAGAPAPGGYYIAHLVAGDYARAVRLLKMK